MVFGNPRAYDNFLDPFIMQRNKNMEELLPLSSMDGLSWQPSIFKKENVIFNTLFGKIYGT